MTAENKMLVAGATSVATQNMIEIVRQAPGWSVTGLCRRPPPSPPEGVRFITADLQDADSCRNAVRDAGFTHLVYVD